MSPVTPSPTPPLRVLELRSVRGTGGGPEKTILLGTAGTDPEQFEVTVCYLRDRRDPVFAIDELAAKLDIPYLEILERHSFDPTILPRLLRLVRAGRFDIVHSHDYKTDLLGWLAARASQATPLATAHTWTGSSNRERVYYFFDKRLLARCYPRVIAVSSHVKETLVRLGARPSRIHLIPNGIDPVRFAPDPKARARLRRELAIPLDQPVIGAVGRLARQKRFDLLLQLAQRLDCDVVIAGAGAQAPVLRALGQALGMGRKLHLLGHRPDPELVMQAFDVYVQTSDNEGTPNSVLEAMAVEVPIVATDAGGTRDLLEPGVHGLVVPVGDLDALTRATQATLRDRVAAAGRVRAARQRVAVELSFDRRMRRVEAVYRQLVQEAGAGQCDRR